MTAHNEEIKVAIIDMNDGIPNEGIGGILKILSQWKSSYTLDMAKKQNLAPGDDLSINTHSQIIKPPGPTINALDLTVNRYDLRAKNEIPGMEYDIYISSGGPGSPFDGQGKKWENDFFDLLDNIEAYNTSAVKRKYVFLICHSFQLACRKYKLGEVTKRKSSVFGIFPVTLTPAGESDLIYAGLQNPFYALDSRDWQVVHSSEERSGPLTAQVLAIEKERTQVNLERCMMSVRFSKEIVGTQFHPEADPDGLKAYLLEEKKKQAIISKYGEEKYRDMLLHIDHPEYSLRPQQSVLPNFLNEVIRSYNPE